MILSDSRVTHYRRHLMEQAGLKFVKLGDDEKFKYIAVYDIELPEGSSPLDGRTIYQGGTYKVRALVSVGSDAQGNILVAQESERDGCTVRLATAEELELFRSQK